jgi:RND family efflux transporter MFP subunit
MSNYSLLFAFANLALLPAALGGCHRSPAAPTAAPSAPASSSAPAVERVTAGKPVVKTLKLTTTQPGRIEGFEQAPLYPKLAGYVSDVLVDIGDSVHKDQLLVKLSIPEMLDEVRQMDARVANADAEIIQAEATVKSAEAALDVARAKIAEAEAGVARANGEYERWHAEYDRIKELASKGSVTEKLVDETQNQLRASEAAEQQANAAVESARAALRAAQANVQKSAADAAAATARRNVAAANLAYSKTMLGYTQIKAPFAGVVTRRNVNTGHYVHPVTGGATEPLLVVEQTDKVRVFVDVPEMEAPFVSAGTKPDTVAVRVQALGDKEFPGTVTRTSRSLESRNRSLRTETDLPNADGVLRPGMYANVEILLDQRDHALTLPLTAIVREGNATYCCTVESGKINRKRVALGLRSGAEVEIRSGLTPEDVVVLTRADSLKQEQPVQIIVK